MPYSLSYTLQSGTASRIVDTPTGALSARVDLQGIGAGAITVRNTTGRIVGIEELKLAAARRARKRDRAAADN